MERQLEPSNFCESCPIALELHDSVGQILTGMALLAQRIERRLRERSLPEVEQMASLLKHIQDAQLRVERLAKGLLALQLGEGDLVGAFEELAERFRLLYGVHCTFQCEPLPDILDSRRSTQIYHIALEAVHNALRHGRPETIQIRLESGREGGSLTIRDDGTGLPGDVGAIQGLGMRIMRHRAGLIPAHLEFQSVPGGGTMVTCLWRNEERGEK